LQPCPAALPGSLARQPCPAALPGSNARQNCKFLKWPGVQAALHTITGQRPADFCKIFPLSYAGKDDCTGLVLLIIIFFDIAHFQYR
jgi:hypothetical protein